MTHMVLLIIANEKMKKEDPTLSQKTYRSQSKQFKKIKNLQANEYIIKDSEKFKETSLHEDPVIIAESEELIKTLSVSEAIMLMNLNDQNAIFFKNINNKRLNILFRRPDGNIGWLDPKK